MKIRTEGELFDKLDNELAWRRADITRLRKVILDNKLNNDLLYRTLLRSSIPLIYSHWEGFIKESSLAYFNFISLRKFLYKELSKGFLSLYIQSEFLNRQYETEFEKALAILQFFDNQLGERSNIRNIPEPIRTRSNLNSTVLKEITNILELDYEIFRGFEVFIDSKLLESRNKVAHGEYREIDWNLYDQAHSIVLQLIQQFKTQIENQVIQKKYLKISTSI